MPITAEETKDFDLLSTFMRGNGIVRLCSGGYDTSGIDMRSAIESFPGFYVLVKDSDSPVGFVAFNPPCGHSCQFHLCLRTRGKKTVEAVKSSFAVAKSFGFTEFVALYPSFRRSIDRLLDTLGFSAAEDDFNHPIPYTRRTLIIQ